MKRIEDEAIILKIQPLSGRDRRITFLSRSHGKKTAIAKGALGSRRFGAAFELFQVSILEWVEKPQSTLVRIDRGEAKHTFWELRKDYDLLKTAAKFSELLDKSLLESQSQSLEDNLPLYAFFANLLHTLNQPGTPKKSWVSAMKWRWMRLIGFPPRLTGCALCDIDLNGKMVAFNSMAGGCVCENCKEFHARPLDHNARRDLIELYQLPYEKLGCYSFSEEFSEISDVLVHEWMESHIPEVVSSIQFTASGRSSAI